ncbi:radial spoke head 10 homolog B-like isoform X2 [Periplaneta americana]|uniref:radial spoke head 10 homolog B-like isoform X2 n=1 Tax=Periplaneta americana TaxID=6978 RepID=UPI0037E906AB
MYFYSTQILKKRNSKEGHSITKEQRNNNHNQSHVSIQETMEKETSNLSKDSVVASEKQESGDKTASKGSVVDWRVSFPDEDVSIVFKQGNCYEGRISRKMLEGYGCFKWTDGSCYKGEFVNGEMIGHGILEWPDQSWYEGEVYRGHRHGHGIYVTNEKNVTYYGGWYMGVKHGEGIIYYGNKGDNYYEGEFLNGLYNGIGYRQYPTGARYIGEWKSGLCHGTGTMVWPNNDVYYGNWECGTKTGYGTYMWDVITSSELVMTSIDVYQGYWQNDLRHGKGSLIKQCGNRILGEWSMGKKNGFGVIVCGDGTVKTGDPLFKDDRLTGEDDGEQIVSAATIVKCKKNLYSKSETIYDEVQHKDDKGNKNNSLTKKISCNEEKCLIKPKISVLRDDDRKSLVAKKDYRYSLKSSFLLHRKKSEKNKYVNEVTESHVYHEARGAPVKILLHATNYDLSYHLARLQKSMQKNVVKINLPLPSTTTVNEEESSHDSQLMEKINLALFGSSIAKAEKRNQGEQTQTNKDMGPHRMDTGHVNEEVGLSSKNVSTEDITEIVIDEGTLQILEFEKKWLHKAILLHLHDLRRVYDMYATLACSRKPNFMYSLMRMMFWQLERDCGLHKRNISLSEIDDMFAENTTSYVDSVHEPFERILFWQFLQYLLEVSWLLYASKGIGYKGAPGILGSAFIKLVREDILPNAGNHEGPEPITYSKTIPEDRNPPQDSQLPMDDPLATQLISFCKLGPTKVTDYLTEVCPAIISEDLICNMDYKLTFLEFYEVLLLCAEGLLRMQATEATKLAKLEVKNQYDSNVTAEDTKTTKIISNSNNTLNRATNKKKKYKS